MATSVTLPALGESVTEGTVTRWLKQPGEEVAVDEPLVEVSTDKVDTEIPSPAAGVLLEIKVGEDETVEVGTELALIGDASEAGGGGGDGQAESAEQGGEEAGAEPEQQAEPEQPEQERQPAPEQQATPRPEPEEQPAPKPAGGGGGGTPVTLPALGESVTEGTVTRWLKSVGDEVAVDEPLLEVSTDKVDTEIPSPAAGVLVEIKVGEDETVEVGAELAVIGQPSDQPTEQPAEQPQEAAEPSATPRHAAAEAATPLEAEAREHAAAEAQSEAKSEQKDAASAGGPAPAQPPQAAPAQQRAVREEQTREERPQAPAEVASRDGETSQYVTPLVRRLAAEHGVDLSSVEGTGVGGRIRKQDVLAAAEAARRPAEPEAQPAPAKAPTPAPAAASPLRGRTEKLSRLRATIARRMVESLQVSAQLTTVLEVDVTAISRLRQRAKRDFEAREGVKLSFLPFFAKAALEALKAHPKLNATLDTETGEVTYFDAEHLGVAVDTERGLLVPVIRDAGDLNIGGLARKIADLAERTRNNKIGPDDLSGGTFTLTNTGSRGALFDTPIINQPQVGILGTGAVVKRPVVVTDADGADSIAIRSMVFLALTYDHRLVDGADAARFLSAVKQRLEGGQFEADLGL